MFLILDENMDDSLEILRFEVGDVFDLQGQN